MLAFETGQQKLEWAEWTPVKKTLRTGHCSFRVPGACKLEVAQKICWRRESEYLPCKNEIPKESDIQQ